MKAKGKGWACNNHNMRNSIEMQGGSGASPRLAGTTPLHRDAGRGYAYYDCCIPIPCLLRFNEMFFTLVSLVFHCQIHAEVFHVRAPRAHLSFGVISLPCIILGHQNLPRILLEREQQEHFRVVGACVNNQADYLLMR